MTTAIFDTCRSLIRSFVGTSPADKMDVENPRRKGLFAQCTFALVRSAAFTAEDAESVSRTLLQVGFAVANWDRWLVS